MSSTPSPKTSLAKLVLYPKPKPFKVMVLGQSGVGKSALVVRFITRRFIGEYDPNLEKIYSFQTVMDNEMVCFEILDSAGETQNDINEKSNCMKTNESQNCRIFAVFILCHKYTSTNVNLEFLTKGQILEINVIRLIKRLFYMQVPNKRPAKPFIGEASQESEYANLETNIRWAEAFILMYSVTDKCSFDECHRLKFLINYNKRRRRLASTMKDSVLEMPPVVMVGNKADQLGDRMVFTDEGKRLSKEIGCVCFHEISVRESIEQVWGVFRDARRFWRVSKWSSGRSEDARIALSRPLGPASSDSTGTATAPVPFCRRWTELEVEEEALVAEVGGGFGRNDSTSSSGRSEGEEFRARASTDSRLPPRPARERHPPPSPAPPSHAGTAAHTTARRCSVAMRGDSAPSY